MTGSTTHVPADRQTRWRTALTLGGVAVLVAAVLDAVLLRPSHQVVLGIVLVALSALVVLTARAARINRIASTAAVLGLLVLLGQLLWLVIKWYPGVVTAQTAALALTFVAFAGVWSMRNREPLEGPRRSLRLVLRVVGGGAVAVAGLLSAAVVVNTITPAPLASTLQASFGQRNSFDSAGPQNAESVLPDGTRLTSDIQYGTTYPNSYLDIYIAGGDGGVDRPTIFNVHGGGFIVGDKVGGDPAAGGTGGDAVTLQPLLDAGYNYVSINYALAPGATYPTATEQASEAMKFLQEKGAAYGLDMTRVILTGGSAGGQVVGQLANIETNPAYADEIGIPAVMAVPPVAVLLDSPVLDVNRAAQTQSASVGSDFLFGFAARAYVGTSQTTIHQANITEHVTKDYPATFVSDGNTGTFPDQAEELHDKLDGLGVTNDLVLYPRSVAILGHGYMATASPQTTDYTAKKLAFLNRVLG